MSGAEEKQPPVSPIEEAFRRRVAKLQEELDAKIIERARHLISPSDGKTGGK